jgi:hypothetical protein
VTQHLVFSAVRKEERLASASFSQATGSLQSKVYARWKIETQSEPDDAFSEEAPCRIRLRSIFDRKDYAVAREDSYIL